MIDPIPRYVLDSYALVAYFQKEPGWQQVESLFQKAQSSEVLLFLSTINLGEVYYIVSIDFDDAKAQTALSAIQHLPITTYDFSFEDVISAAKLKSAYHIAYADTFAISLAQKLNATVITGDPEFKEVEELITIEWLPPKSKKQKAKI